MFKSPRLQAIAIAALFCALYALWIAPIKLVSIADLKIRDSYFDLASRISTLPKAGSDVVLVDIDDESLRLVNMQWPWPRSVIAGIIAKINACSPRVISADLVFSGKSVDPEEDAALLGALKERSNVLAAAYFGSDGKYVIPDERIALGLADFGFVNKPRDADNAVRRMRPYFLSPSGEIIDYSLSLKTAGRIMNVPAGNLAMRLPLSKDGSAYIRFFGKADRFSRVPVWKVMDGSVEPAAIRDKVIFLGITSESFHDTYATPLGMMPGVVIDLNEALTYMSGNFFRYASGGLNLAILFIFVLIAVAAALRLPVLAGTLFGAVLLAASYFFGFTMFMLRVITDAFGPVLLIVVSTVLLHATRSFLLVLENVMLKKEAITDGLTGLFVYRYFELQLKKEMAAALRSRKDLALVIYDIDHFKKINDTYGHEFGNIVLKSIAKSLKDHSRKNNIIARYGGEEFCIIIMGMDRDHAIKYSERLRNLVSSLEFKTDKGDIVKVTMSAGIAMANDIASKDPTDFVKAADSALYKSKSSGRDRISVFGRE